MKNNRFWNWVRNEETGASEMYLYGAIAESTWFENDITPALFFRHQIHILQFPNVIGGHPAVLSGGSIALHSGSVVTTQKPIYIGFREIQS